MGGSWVRLFLPVSAGLRAIQVVEEQTLLGGVTPFPQKPLTLGQHYSALFLVSIAACVWVCMCACVCVCVCVCMHACKCVLVPLQTEWEVKETVLERRDREAGRFRIRGFRSKFNLSWFCGWGSVRWEGPETLGVEQSENQTCMILEAPFPGCCSPPSTSPHSLPSPSQTPRPHLFIQMHKTFRFGICAQSLSFV